MLERFNACLLMSASARAIVGSADGWTLMLQECISGRPLMSAGARKLNGGQQMSTDVIGRSCEGVSGRLLMSAGDC
jgi:hypothetical protein